MKKILISDYDHTLYLDDESMKLNIEKINEFRSDGNLFVIATGRSFESLNPKFDKYSISFDYLILSHGAIVLNKDKKIIISYTIQNDIIERIVESIKKFEGINNIKYFGIYEDDINANDKITKFRVATRRIIESERISKYINENFNEHVKSYVVVAKKYISVEIISANTSKAVAIEKVLNIENIDVKNVYAIGDGSNDVEMIKKYNGYGMKNSEQFVLSIASKLYNNVYELIDDIK